MNPILIKYEQNLISQGHNYIAGVDEVGRGALAGPMVIGAVILKKADLLEVTEYLTNNDITNPKINTLAQINDSKLLNDKKRRELSKFIMSVAISYSIEVISNKAIDKKGISACTRDGFSKVIQNLAQKPDHVLTDAFSIHTLDNSLQTNIKHGDRLSITIAAASIVAKVYRDDLMINLHTRHEGYKVYQFDKNKAYGTQLHLQALQKYGPSDIHRLSYEPVKSMIKQINVG